MPVVYTNSLGSTALAESFLYVNDSAEDGDFTSFLEGLRGTSVPGQSVDNILVDRTGTPELRWDARFNSTVTPHSIALVSDTYWRGRVTAVTGISPFDMTGCWECDEYGRPFDLDDLVAPPAP